MIPRQTVPATLSGGRFTASYLLVGDEREARAAAEDICIEQSVEFPPQLVPDGVIKDHIFGRIESFGMAADDPGPFNRYEAVISFADEIAGAELTQLLNVLFGNISIKLGIQLAGLELSHGVLAGFKGPRFGRAGLRELAGRPGRPLVGTALKPMGLCADDLAALAYDMARGGIDLIKDDHGLADQSFCPFRERIEKVARAVERANAETGGRTLYAPNVTAPADRLLDRALFAKSAGAKCLVLAPALTGLDAMRALADDDRVALPILSHPAFLGSFLTCRESGIAHEVLLGLITRLAGADAVIYPNFGGRFSFSEDECRRIVRGTARPMGDVRPIFPAPGGGMTLVSIPRLREVYGPDVIFLVGGGLFRHGPDLVENCRFFRSLVDTIAS